MTNGATGKIDFNADIGESFAGYELGLDSEIVKYITSANIATGFHAGDPDWMARTVSLAIENGVGIGAHPAYPDLAGFGRRNMDLTPAEVHNAVTYQVGALAAARRAAQPEGNVWSPPPWEVPPPEQFGQFEKHRLSE